MTRLTLTRACVAAALAGALAAVPILSALVSCAPQAIHVRPSPAAGERWVREDILGQPEQSRALCPCDDPDPCPYGGYWTDEREEDPGASEDEEGQPVWRCYEGPGRPVEGQAR